MRRPRLLILLVVLLALAPPVVTAQDAGDAPQGRAPVIVDATTPTTQRVAEGHPAEFAFDLVNLNPERAFYVTVSVDGLERWRSRPSDSGFLLEPQSTVNLTLQVVPQGRVGGVSTGSIQVTFVDTETGEEDVREEDLEILVQDAARVVGLFRNPLPPPLDNEYGVFLLNVTAWAAFGLLAFYAGGALVRTLTRNARKDVTRHLVQRLRWPIFAFVLLLGLRASFDALPRGPVTVAVNRLLSAVAVGLVGAFLIYRILDAVLLYYAGTLAPRMRVKVDTVLVPAMRKVLIAAVGTIAVIYVLSVYDVNLGVIFGAAGLAGLVLAFAAQETINNFLSGVFILFDRPFTEGEDIQLETGEVVRVETIGMRSTRLYHYRNHELIVLPNKDLASRRVVNLTAPDPRYKINIEVGVAYGSDVEKVKRALREAVDGVEGVTDPEEDPPIILLLAFADSSLNFMLRFGVDDYRERWSIASDVRERVDALFRRDGIEIPFPQRSVWMRAKDAGAGPAGDAAGGGEA